MHGDEYDSMQVRSGEFGWLVYLGAKHLFICYVAVLESLKLDFPSYCGS